MDFTVICEFEEENSRLGHFERIFPLKKNIDYYNKLMEPIRHNDLLLARHLRNRGKQRNFLKKYLEKKNFLRPPMRSNCFKFKARKK
jgi:hypothetical protein